MTTPCDVISSAMTLKRQSDNVTRDYNRGNATPVGTDDPMTPFESTGAPADARPASGVIRSAQPILEKLIDLAPDSILVCDRQGRICELNARTEQMFGYQRGELLGQSIDVLVPERFRGTHPKRRESYAHRPTSRPMGVGLELFGRRKDGSEFPVDIMLSPVEGAEGPMFLSVVRDVTEQRAAQDALHRTEQQLLMLVENVPDHAIFLVDTEGRIQTWNAGAERIKGYKSEEIIGQNISIFYPAEEVERGTPLEMRRIAAEKGRYESEGWRIRKDGSRFWANTILTALHDREGRVTGFAKVTRDFSGRKQAENALLVQLSSALMSTLDFDTLLSAVSATMRDAVPHDEAGIAIYHPEDSSLHARFLGNAENVPEFIIPVEGSPSGKVFTSRLPLLLATFPGPGFKPDAFRHLTSRGLRSGCWLPLIHEERVIGTMLVASKREATFQDRDLEILSHVARQVAAAVYNALTFRKIAESRDKLAQEKRYLEEELNTENRFDEIIGDTPDLKRVLKQVETVAPTDASVLVLGETGTGKELIARAIHRLSSRRTRTFVKLNCAAIPSGLLESELFGHERGAFTGAISQKIGRLELAHQGTLFLDEVGDIPLELQPKLLRALQEKEFERLGSTRTIKVDVRLVAATNRDLAGMVAQKEFRSDLYYRLKVFPVQLPALRERRDDIPLLVRYFVDTHARNLGKKIESIPPDVMKALVRWDWPGNIRELENFIERAVILTTGSTLRVPLAELQIAESAAAENEDLASAEREHIVRVLRETRGVIAGPTGAAARLGLKRTTLNAKMKKLGIERKDFD